MKIINISSSIVSIFFTVGCQTTFHGKNGKVSPNESTTKSSLAGTLDDRTWQYSLGIAEKIESDDSTPRMRLSFYEGYDTNADPNCEAKRLKETDVEIILSAPLLVGTYELPSDKVTTASNSFSYRNDISFAKDMSSDGNEVGTDFLGDGVSGKIVIDTIDEKSVSGQLSAAGTNGKNKVAGSFRAIVCPRKD